MGKRGTLYNTCFTLLPQCGSSRRERRPLLLPLLPELAKR